jgi:hypothetical protein
LPARKIFQSPIVSIQGQPLYLCRIVRRRSKTEIKLRQKVQFLSNQNCWQSNLRFLDVGRRGIPWHLQQGVVVDHDELLCCRKLTQLEIFIFWWRNPENAAKRKSRKIESRRKQPNSSRLGDACMHTCSCTDSVLLSKQQVACTLILMTTSEYKDCDFLLGEDTCRYL